MIILFIAIDHMFVQCIYMVVLIINVGFYVAERKGYFILFREYIFSQKSERGTLGISA